MDEEKIKIYSYTKVWKHEKKIYNIMNLILPTPINPYDLASFFGILILEMVVGEIFPPLSRLPFIVKYFILPYLGTYILRKKKLDGKNPIFYFAGILRYYLTISGTYVECFRRMREKKTEVSLDWYCSRGRVKGERT